MPVVGALCTNTRELVDPHDLEKSPGNRRINSQASIPRVRGKWSNSCPTVLLSSPKHCFGRGYTPPPKQCFGLDNRTVGQELDHLPLTRGIEACELIRRFPGLFSRSWGSTNSRVLVHNAPTTGIVYFFCNISVTYTLRS